MDVEPTVAQMKAQATPQNKPQTNTAAVPDDQPITYKPVKASDVKAFFSGIAKVESQETLPALPPPGLVLPVPPVPQVLPSEVQKSLEEQQEKYTTREDALLEELFDLSEEEFQQRVSAAVHHPLFPKFCHDCVDRFIAVEVIAEQFGKAPETSTEELCGFEMWLEEQGASNAQQAAAWQDTPQIATPRMPVATAQAPQAPEPARPVTSAAPVVKTPKATAPVHPVTPAVAAPVVAQVATTPAVNTSTAAPVGPAAPAVATPAMAPVATTSATTSTAAPVGSAADTPSVTPAAAPKALPLAPTPMVTTAAPVSPVAPTPPVAPHAPVTTAEPVSPVSVVTTAATPVVVQAASSVAVDLTASSPVSKMLPDNQLGDSQLYPPSCGSPMPTQIDASPSPQPMDFKPVTAEGMQAFWSTLRRKSTDELSLAQPSPQTRVLGTDMSPAASAAASPPTHDPQSAQQSAETTSPSTQVIADTPPAPASAGDPVTPVAPTNATPPPDPVTPVAPTNAAPPPQSGTASPAPLTATPAPPARTTEDDEDIKEAKAAYMRFYRSVRSKNAAAAVAKKLNFA